MQQINTKDKDLIDIATRVLNDNYDGHYHTVACAVKCSNGKIYTGINMDVIHGSCAEFIAVGTALTNKEREFDTVVSVAKTNNGIEVVNPCGNCRQMFLYLAPNVNVICKYNSETSKYSLEELLPIEYRDHR